MNILLSTELMLYRPGTGIAFIVWNWNSDDFYPDFATTLGIGDYNTSRYDLKSPNDLAFAFDYDHIWKKDHIALYRPGGGTIWILKKTGHSFTPVYRHFDPVYDGIGLYDLKSKNDRAFSFDYDHTGREDHIALYRPGAGVLWILKNVNGVFSAVYRQYDPNYNGIGGYNLRSINDHALAFDYDHSGKQDHIVLYRAGSGTIWILKNVNGAFSPVFKEGDPNQLSGTFNGIGGYNLLSTSDQAFAFDYDHSGKMDHLVFYRPGAAIIWILKNLNGTFTPVYKQSDSPSGQGIGGYDLAWATDNIIAFDYIGNGKKDHLVCTRAGTGIVYILKNENGVFSQVYTKQWAVNNTGIGGFDLGSTSDKVITIDY